jgi:cullin-associated NEDD8-dissociated protein 1
MNLGSSLPSLRVNEEGTRNVVAECLGKLTLTDPEGLLPRLRAALNCPSALMRSTIVTAAKFRISDQVQTIDPLLKQCMGGFLQTLQVNNKVSS